MHAVHAPRLELLRTPAHTTCVPKASAVSRASHGSIKRPQLMTVPCTLCKFAPFCYLVECQGVALTLGPSPCCRTAAASAAASSNATFMPWPEGGATWAASPTNTTWPDVQEPCSGGREGR